MKVLDIDGLKRVASNVKDKITEEADARKDADTSLGTRIGSVETDLTGIKGLTYGTNASKLVDVADGSYCSPALDEISHEIKTLQAAGWYIDEYANPSVDKYNKLVEKWPKCALIANAKITSTSEKIPYLLLPTERGSDYVQFCCLTARDDRNDMVSAIYAVYKIKDGSVTRNAATANITLANYVTWGNTTNKPFSIIGSGLKVEDDALAVDTDALPKGTEVNNIAPLVAATTPVDLSLDGSGTAVGSGARAFTQAIALGTSARAGGVNSVALGNTSYANEALTVSVGNIETSLTRRITNVTDPTNAHDAATKNYVDTAIAGATVGALTNDDIDTIFTDVLG